MVTGRTDVYPIPKYWNAVSLGLSSVVENYGSKILWKDARNKK